MKAKIVIFLALVLGLSFVYREYRKQNFQDQYNAIIEGYESYENKKSEEILIVPITDTVSAHILEGQFDPITLLHRGAIDKFDKDTMLALREEQNKNPLDGGAKLIQTLKFQPIDFHGRFIDQYGDPVVGAKLRIHVSQPGKAIAYAYAAESKTLGLRATTNENGEIHIKNVQGQYFIIESLQANGYVFVSNLVRKIFGSSKELGMNTMSNNPHIFRGWKVEHDTNNVRSMSLTYTSKIKSKPSVEYTVDLDVGNYKQNFRVGNNGDFTIRVDRQWDLYEKNRGHSSRIIIDVNNGGMIEVDDEQRPYAYLAPEKGYKNRIELSKIRSEMNNREWKRGKFIKTFYYRFSKNNKVYYASLKMNVSPFVDTDRINFRVTGFYNQDGKRNLMSSKRKNYLLSSMNYRYDN